MKHPCDFFFSQKPLAVFKKQFFNWSRDKSRVAVVVLELNLLNSFVFNAKKKKSVKKKRSCAV